MVAERESMLRSDIVSTDEAVEEEITITMWSTPDSIGNQHPVETRQISRRQQTGLHATVETQQLKEAETYIDSDGSGTMSATVEATTTATTRPRLYLLMAIGAAAGVVIAVARRGVRP